MTGGKIVLLIDADNVSADVMEQAVHKVLAEHGALHVRRAYGTAEMALKHQALFRRLSIRPMVNLATGKNSTDIALAVDAMDLAVAERPQVVYLVSSDSDFAPLVSRLREKGCRVCGIGQQGKTGEDTVAVYDAFTDLRHKGGEATATPASAPAPARSRSALPAAVAKKAAARAAGASAAQPGSARPTRAGPCSGTRRSRSRRPTRARARAREEGCRQDGRPQDAGPELGGHRRLRSGRVHPPGRAGAARRRRSRAQRHRPGAAHLGAARAEREFDQAVREAAGGIRRAPASGPHPLDRRERALSPPLPPPLPAIDWAQPWLAPYRAAGAQAASGIADGASVAGVLNRRAGTGHPRFVEQSRLPPGEPYERFIFETGAVPTRDNPHDFFNGLVWLRFPKAKRRLNELQAGEIAHRGVGATRGPLRDALTLFDENGAVLDAPPALWSALVARDWHRLFVAERALWREARLLVFGHALLEKLAAPRKALTAHVLPAPVPGFGPSAPSIAPEDEALAAALHATHLAQKPFVPLPVLGVPGWWPGNQNFRFYDDSDVFRPPRPRAATTTTSTTKTPPGRCPPAA
jgi:hypothetical protein